MADWEEVAKTQEFEALLVRRRSFVVPALLVWTRTAPSWSAAASPAASWGR